MINKQYISSLPTQYRAPACRGFRVVLRRGYLYAYMRIYILHISAYIHSVKR